MQTNQRESISINSRHSKIQLDNKRKIYGILVVIVVISAIIHIWAANAQSLEFDEGYSLWFAALSYQEIWTDVPKIDSHPTLYYALLKYWVSLFGDGNLAIRSLSIIFNILTIPIIFIISKNLTHDNQAYAVGLVAALFFAISPMQLTWPLMARPYAMMIFCIAITCAGFSWYVRHALSIEKNSWSFSQTMADVAIVFGSALALWSDNMSTLFIAALICYLFWWTFIEKSCPYRITIRLIILWTCSLLLWSPYAHQAIQQASTVTSNLLYVDGGSPINFINNIITLFSINSFMRVPSSILFIILCYQGIKSFHVSADKNRVYFLLSLLILPFIFEIIIAVILLPLMSIKTHIWVSIPLFIAISHALFSLSNRRVRNMLIGLITIISLVGCYLSDMSPRGRADLWPSIASITRGGNGAKLPVIFYPNDHTVMYYREISRLPNFQTSLYNDIVPVPGPFPQLDLDRPTMTGVPIVRKEDVPIALNTINHANEFWLIHDTSDFFDPDFAFLTEIEKTYELIDSKIWGGLYRKKTPQ